MHFEFFDQTTTAQTIPIINPNFARFDHQIFFALGKQHRSNSAMASLTVAEQDLFDAIDGHLNLQHLNDCFAPVMASIALWYDMGILEFIDNPRPASDHHLLVLEPHMDDAALSVGGALLKRKDQQQVSVMTMVGQTNFTSYSKSKSFATDFVSHRRLLESHLMGKMLNASHYCLNQVDQPLRWRDDHQALDLATVRCYINS